MRKVTLFNNHVITVDLEQSGDNWSASYAIQRNGELVKQQRHFLIKASSRSNSAHIALNEAKAWIAKNNVLDLFGPAIQSSRAGTSRQTLYC
jgi:hypothetical protein